MRPFFAALLLCALPSPAQACSGEACCVRYGVPAVCRSPVIEERAKGIVMRRCPRCDARAVTRWVFSYQMTRGPYERERDLADDAMGRHR